jgi:hypothetical protein
MLAGSRGDAVRICGRDGLTDGHSIRVPADDHRIRRSATRKIHLPGGGRGVNEILKRGQEAVFTIATVLCLSVSSAQAGDWFVEGGAGASFATLRSVRYDDPVGALFTVNAHDARGIVPEKVKRSAWFPGAAASVG